MQTISQASLLEQGEAYASATWAQSLIAIRRGHACGSDAMHVEREGFFGEGAACKVDRRSLFGGRDKKLWEIFAATEILGSNFFVSLKKSTR